MQASDDAEIDVEPQRAAQMLADGVRLIDVRERYERDAGFIAGSEHVELTQLAAAAAAIDRDSPVVFYCRMGARSTMAAEAFRSSGYVAYNLAGGILAWVDAGLPLEPDGGYVADH
jgi:hydroxyacylglutathione hydrolase/adenylyltransferase/sulfurtransferase